MKKPPPHPDLSEAREAAKLARALWFITCRMATDAELSEVAVMGAVTLVLGRVARTVLRSGELDLDRLMGFLNEKLRQAVEGDFPRRTVH